MADEEPGHIGDQLIISREPQQQPVASGDAWCRSFQQAAATGFGARDGFAEGSAASDCVAGPPQQDDGLCKASSSFLGGRYLARNLVHLV
jgi:hypothetical protein